MLSEGQVPISTTDRTHARTGPDTQRAQAHNHTQNSNTRTQPRHVVVHDLARISTRALTRGKLLAEGGSPSSLPHRDPTMTLAFTTAQKTLQSIKSMLPRLVTSGVVVAGEPTLYVEPANVLTVCDFLKNHTGTRCKALMDVTAIDVPTREKRFEVRLRPASDTTAAASSLPSAACLHAHWCSLRSICAPLNQTPCPRLAQVAYQLLSVEHNSRMRVKTLVGGHEGDSGVPSLAGIFSSANWLEREVWDMYGIYFEGHPDLRRILTDYGFQGHPLRKDFPLSGFVECRYDPSKKRVVTEPLELTQEFRQFEFLSPWKEK